MSKNKVINLNAKREKTKIKSKILRFRNDLKDHRIKDFSSCDFEDDRWHSRTYFSLFSP